MLAMLDQIEACLHGDHHLAAIMLALTVPETAAALVSETGEPERDGYGRWFDAFLLPRYPLLSAEACRRMRLGLALQGPLGPLRARYARVLFTVPSASGDAFHNEVFNDALNLDTPTFCRDVTGAARRWLEAEAGNATVRRNLATAMALHPAGLDPFMVGVPLIA